MEKEKKIMCWLPAGEIEKDCREGKRVRVQTRIHNDFGMEFEKLDAETQAKDMKPIKYHDEKIERV